MLEGIFPEVRSIFNISTPADYYIYSFGNCQINDAHDVDTCPLSCVKDMLENIATHFPTDDSEDVERLFLNPQSMLNISKQKFQILCQ